MGALWLQEWMSGLLNCLPAAQRARARLRIELDRMQARARRMGWSKIALIASLAIMVNLAAASVFPGRSQVPKPQWQQIATYCLWHAFKQPSKVSREHTIPCLPGLFFLQKGSTLCAHCTSMDYQDVHCSFASNAGGFCRLWWPESQWSRTLRSAGLCAARIRR